MQEHRGEPVATKVIVEAEVSSQSPFDLKLRWPTNLTSWIGLIILAVLACYMFKQGQTEVASILFALLLKEIGATNQQAALGAGILQASQHAAHTAQVAEETRQEVKVVQEAVKDIQENPTQPGTPGWMERHDNAG